MDDKTIRILRNIRAQEEMIREAGRCGYSPEMFATLVLTQVDSKERISNLRNNFTVLRRLNNKVYKEYLEMISVDYKRWLCALGIRFEEEPMEV